MTKLRSPLSVAALLVGVSVTASCAGGGTEAAAPSPTVAAASSTSLTPDPTTEPVPPADACAAFVGTLTERQRLAQLLTVGVTGTADAVDIMAREQVGGIFIGSWTDTATLANREVPQIVDAAAVPPMVTMPS